MTRAQCSFVLAALVASAPAIAHAQTPGLSSATHHTSTLIDRAPTSPVSVERPEELDRFVRALRSLERGERRRVRIAHYGDSNVAAGVWTAATRAHLQRVYGDGGPGFLTVGTFGTYPWSTPRLATAGFNGRRYSFQNRFGPLDGLWGLAGVAGEGAGTQARIRIQVEDHPRARTLEVHALGWPRGGSFVVMVDGRPVSDASTASPSLAVVRRQIPLSAGAHQIIIRVTSWRPVRILGAVIEDDQAGVVYDTLGINGQRMGTMREWNSELWAQHLASREPDLVVLGYGGNEALDVDLSLDRYREQLERSLSRVREVAPNSSCLMVTPIAMCNRPRNQQVNAIQREVAPRYGCALWDASRVSGGPDSLCGWIRAGLVSRDRLHLNEEGYRRIGDALGTALLRAAQRR